MLNYLCKIRHDSRGMTLVELLIVMGILSVVMMAVISLYIPAHQSTVAQTQVSDVQSNLRLALKTMTRDLLIAGFLVPNSPIAFPDADPDYYVDIPTDPGTRNDGIFIIRTRVVGNAFARVSGVTSISGGFRLTVSQASMLDNFPSDSKVRLFEPINANEVIGDTPGTEATRVYNVQDVNYTTPSIDITGGDLEEKDILEETVVVGVLDSSQPALQTIRYRLNNGALERIVNNRTQILARNVEAVFFSYDPADDPINRVFIRLTGKTEAGEKTRTVETSVKLRNVF